MGGRLLKMFNDTENVYDGWKYKGGSVKLKYLFLAKMLIQLSWDLENLYINFHWWIDPLNNYKLSNLAFFR